MGNCSILSCSDLNTEHNILIRSELLPPVYFPDMDMSMSMSMSMHVMPLKGRSS